MKKGFSIVELLVSITLISTIILLLFQVIVSLKSLYTKDSTNTSMLVNQASVSYLINSHLEEKGFKEADNCVAGQVDCITITYLDNTIEEVKVDSNSNTIKIGNKLYKYPTGTTISLPIVDKELIDSDTLDYDTIFKLKINVSNKLFKNKDYNINIVHVFEDAPIVPTVPAKVYGLRWDGNDIYTRLEDAEGMVANAGIGTNAVTNDFDNAEIYKDIVDVTVDGNVFVKIPKFYIKKVVTGDTWEWYVSKEKKDNAYYLPECFKDESGNELDYVLIGKYDASLNGTKLESKTGVSPATGISMDTSRTYVANNNANGVTGYQLFDIHALDAIQVLFYIEFGTVNSKSIMYGYVDGYKSKLKSGTTDIVLSSSGSTSSNSDGLSAMKYRGIENLWGNIYEYVDGIYVKNSAIYVNKKPSTYANYTSTGTQYYLISYSKLNSCGFISKMGYDSNNPFIQLPVELSGTSSTKYADFYYGDHTGERIMAFGGDASSGIGLNFIYFRTESSTGGNRICARIMKKPL